MPKTATRWEKLDLRLTLADKRTFNAAAAAAQRYHKPGPCGASIASDKRSVLTVWQLGEPSQKPLVAASIGVYGVPLGRFSE
jgi:hypothetical protein